MRSLECEKEVLTQESKPEERDLNLHHRENLKSVTISYTVLRNH